METVATNEVEAAVSSVDAAEGKGMESVPEKKVSRKSHHKQEGKELCTGRICRRAKLSCCGMCHVSTNENVQLVCSRKPNKKKWQNQEGK